MTDGDDSLSTIDPLDGNDRWFVYYDASAAYDNKGIGRAKIYGKIGCTQVEHLLNRRLF
jgi:hypothetical protein